MKEFTGRAGKNGSNDRLTDRTWYGRMRRNLFPTVVGVRFGIRRKGVPDIPTQEEYDRIMSLEKFFEKKLFFFPRDGNKLTLDAFTSDRRERIAVVITSSSMVADKITKHGMYQDNSGLLRIDLGDTLIHTNPDFTRVEGSHIHYYVPGYGITWAKPLSDICLESHLNYNQLKDQFEIFKYFCGRLNIVQDWTIQVGF